MHFVTIVPFETITDIIAFAIVPALILVFISAIVVAIFKMGRKAYRRRR